MSNADKIENGVRQVMTNDALGLVLDLSEVDYFDSAGIHLIYGLREHLRAREVGALLRHVDVADSRVGSGQISAHRLQGRGGVGQAVHDGAEARAPRGDGAERAVDAAQ